MSKSVLKQADFAVALQMVGSQPEDNDLIRTISVAAKHVTDALDVLFSEGDISTLINAYVCAWLQTGAELAKRDHIISIADMSPLEAIETYESLSYGIREEHFKLLKPVEPEIKTIESAFQEFGNSRIFHEQLAVTCYRACEAAFLATRKPTLVKTIIRAD